MASDQKVSESAVVLNWKRSCVKGTGGKARTVTDMRTPNVDPPP